MPLRLLFRLWAKMWCSRTKFNLEFFNRCRVRIGRVFRCRKALGDKIIRWSSKHLIISRWTKDHSRDIEWQKNSNNIIGMTPSPRRTTWRWKASQMRMITLSQIIAPLITRTNSSSCIFRNLNHGQEELVKLQLWIPRIFISRQRWTRSSQKPEGLSQLPFSLRS